MTLALARPGNKLQAESWSGEGHDRRAMMNHDAMAFQSFARPLARRWIISQPTRFKTPCTKPSIPA